MNESESRAALSGLAGPLVVADAESLAAQHAVVQPRLRELVRGLPARRRKRRLRRVCAVAAGLALSAGLAVAVWQVGATDTAPFTLERGSLISLQNAGSGFVTSPEDAVTLRTREGASIAVAAASRVESITSQAQHEQVVLHRGSLRVQVPRLVPGGTFSVRTPDALVTVHGTVFSVSVAGEAGRTQTCVRVVEGVVRVVRDGVPALLKQGEQLNCPSSTGDQPLREPAPAAATASVPSGSASPIERPRTSLPAIRPLAPPAADAGLGEQNRLLAAALQAERAGRLGEAQLRLRELLARYPESALRAEAERSLERVQRRLP